MIDSVAYCTEVFHGKDVSEDKRVDALVVELTKHYMEMIELIKEAKAMPDSDKQKSVFGRTHFIVYIEFLKKSLKL